MPRVRPQFRSIVQVRLLAALLGSTMLTALLAAPALAQSKTRTGVVGEDMATAAATGNTGKAIDSAQTRSDDGIAAASYVPSSDGAVPDATARSANDSLFDDLDAAGQDASPEPAPRVPRVPVAATDRDPAMQNTKSQRAATATASNSADDAAVTDDLATGTTKAPKADFGDILPLDGREERVGPLDTNRRPAQDDEPFAAPGIRAGTFVLRPSLEQGLTVTSNADASVGGKSAVLSETTLRLNAVSDWSRHSASVDAFGVFRKSISGDDLKETRAGLDAALQLDLADDLRGLATFGYERRPETASSPVVIDGTASQPLLQTVNGSLGIAKDVGKLRFGVTGRIEHDDYGDADLSTGGTLSQKERNVTLATLTLRGGYEISPALTPFVEGEIGQRRYDQTVDLSGYRRSSDRYGARAGVALDIDDKLRGEISAGWIREGFDDERLAAISGATLNADLAWSPERETTLRLSASSAVEGTTTAGESGSLLHSVTVSAEREIRANLTALASLGGGYRDYIGQDGHDTLFDAQLGATWWLNRYAGLTGRVEYEGLRSTLPDRDYNAASVFLGLRLQR